MDISSQLKDFGLTDYESRVYTTLLGLKQAKVSDIAKLCTVPRNKIYAVAESLHKKGFVEIIPEKVTKFRAVPFDAATQLFIKEQESRLHFLEESAKKISTFLSSFSIDKKDEDSTGEFLVYKSKKMIYKKLREIISQSESKLFLVVSNEDLFHISPIVKSLSKSKKIDVKVLCKVKEDNLELLKKWIYFSDLRHYEKPLPEKIAIVDDSEAFVFQTNSPVALYSKDPQFVALMKSFSSMIWDHSVNVEEKITEIETGVPMEEFRIIKGVENIYEIAKKSSTAARKEIMRIVTEEGLQSIVKEGVLNLEREQTKKNVKIKYMFPITKNNLLLAKELMKFAEVRHMDFIPIQVKIVDNHYCSLRQWEGSDTEPATIISTSHTFVEAMKTYFEKIWADAIPAEKRLASLMIVERVKKEATEQGVPLSEFISPENLETRE